MRPRGDFECNDDVTTVTSPRINVRRLCCCYENDGSADSYIRSDSEETNGRDDHFNSQPISTDISRKRGSASKRAVLPTAATLDRKNWDIGSRISNASRAWRMAWSCIPAAAAAIASTEGGIYDRRARLISSA